MKKHLLPASLGATLFGGSAGGIIQPTTVEEAVPAIVTAVVGALLGTFLSWWKNRRK